ncbi:MAG: hypothetical protein QXI58_03475 [Candidatus Micrarchaeia archaeon]
MNKLQLFSFRISLWDEIHKTISNFQEILLHKLEKYEVFSSLKFIQKKKVIFYLLLHYLPEIAKEMMENQAFNKRYKVYKNFYIL